MFAGGGKPGKANSQLLNGTEEPKTGFPENEELAQGGKPVKPNSRRLSGTAQPKTGLPVYEDFPQGGKAAKRNARRLNGRATASTALPAGSESRMETENNERAKLGKKRAKLGKKRAKLGKRRRLSESNVIASSESNENNERAVLSKSKSRRLGGSSVIASSESNENNERAVLSKSKSRRLGGSSVIAARAFKEGDEKEEENKETKTDESAFGVLISDIIIACVALMLSLLAVLVVLSLLRGLSSRTASAPVIPNVYTVSKKEGMGMDYREVSSLSQDNYKELVSDRDIQNSICPQSPSREQSNTCSGQQKRQLLRRCVPDEFGDSTTNQSFRSNSRRASVPSANAPEKEQDTVSSPGTRMVYKMKPDGSWCTLSPTQCSRRPADVSSTWSSKCPSTGSSPRCSVTPYT
ncbi:uncharacterized protein LOC144772911 [Lissotriton helveticus]